MTTPTIDRFCCGGHDDLPEYLMTTFEALPYNLTCLVSSVISISGCLYQILPRKKQQQQLKSEIFNRQQLVILTLAIADLFASFGILTRSIAWIIKEELYIKEWNNGASGSVFCAVTASWIQYFYSVTYLLNLCYAVDVYRIIHKQTDLKSLYLTVSFGVAAILVSAGMAVIYYPSLKCTISTSSNIVNAICMYAPIVTTMVVNPILYYLSSKEVRAIIQMSLGRWTNHERHIQKRISDKFYKIIAVFYVCWLPNIVTAIMTWADTEASHDAILGLWFLSAVVNPQQALLNAVIYREVQKPSDVMCCQKPVCCCCGDGQSLNEESNKFNLKFDISQSKYLDSADEIMPLLTSSTDRQSSM